MRDTALRCTIIRDGGRRSVGHPTPLRCPRLRVRTRGGGGGSGGKRSSGKWGGGRDLFTATKFDCWPLFFILIYFNFLIHLHPFLRHFKSIKDPISLNIYKNMPVDLLHPSAELEARTHKLKRLVQSPNSFFMDIKCPGCFQITTVFSHAQSVVLCGSCNVMLCQPTGGRARLTEGCSYRKKVD